MQFSRGFLEIKTKRGYNMSTQTSPALIWSNYPTLQTQHPSSHIPELNFLHLQLVFPLNRYCLSWICVSKFLFLNISRGTSFNSSSSCWFQTISTICQVYFEFWSDTEKHFQIFTAWCHLHTLQATLYSILLTANENTKQNWFPEQIPNLKHSLWSSPRGSWPKPLQWFVLKSSFRKEHNTF